MSKEIKNNDQDNASIKPGKTDFALALKVSDRVELESIMLVDCHCRQLCFIKAEARAFNINYSAESSMDTEAKRIIVLAKFKWEGFEADTKEKKQFATIEASFLLMYKVPDLEGINHENVEMFGNLNGIYNAWPYWREFLQNNISRMCLPSLTVPVFRLFPPKKEEATAEKKEDVVTVQEQS